MNINDKLTFTNNLLYDSVIKVIDSRVQEYVYGGKYNIHHHIITVNFYLDYASKVSDPNKRKLVPMDVEHKILDQD